MIHVNHIDVMGLDDQLLDIKLQRFEIEKHEQGNIFNKNGNFSFHSMIIYTLCMIGQKQHEV